MPSLAGGDSLYLCSRLQVEIAARRGRHSGWVCFWVRHGPGWLLLALEFEYVLLCSS